MQFQTDPLFTVIIPVKNRGEYLYHTLMTCIMQDYQNIEIIVSDDASTDNTKEVVELAIKKDARVKLYSHVESLGMRENFEFALNKVKPGYVIALGGDDGLIPGAISKMYNVLSETKTELLTWPNSYYLFKGYYNDTSKLIINYKKYTKVIKSQDYLKKISISLNYFGDSFDCPMFYIKGVASTELINKVKLKSENNRFYSCPTPDGYSGIALAATVNEYAFCGEPLSIGGNSTGSQGRAYLHKDEKSRKEAEAFFNNRGSKAMHKELANQPYSPLITLMTADYLLTVKDLFGLQNDYIQINYSNLIRKSIEEICNRYFDKELIVRELIILENIAKYHGMSELFHEILSSSKRKVRKRLYIKGSIITPRSIILDSGSFEIKNIYEAAHATKMIYNLYKKITVKNIIILILKLFKTFIMSKNYRIEKLPSIDKEGVKSEAIKK